MSQILHTLLALWPLVVMVLVLGVATEVAKKFGLIEVRKGRRSRRASKGTDRGAPDASDDGWGDEWEERENGPKVVTYPYRLRPCVISPAEHKFLLALEKAVNGRSQVLAQVNLASLIEVKTADRSEGQAAYNRICRKHVDFVLCDLRQNALPVLVIELDDSSHNRSVTRIRDQFVDKALAAAGLPILHVPATGNYDPAKLENDIRAKLRGDGAARPHA